MPSQATDGPIADATITNETIADATPTNATVAAVMREIANHLQRRGESPFRVTAFRRAAVTFRRWPESVSELFAKRGIAGLKELPGVGDSIARATANYLRRGRSRRLEALRKAESGDGLLKTLPGVGPRLAGRVGQALNEPSLEEMFAAACDGRLRRVPGVGAKRLRGIRESLASRLQAGASLPTTPPDEETSVGDLLSIDEEYRRKAEAGSLPLTAPRLFNPTGTAWLPILRTERNGRTYLAHFANSARSHQLGRFREWVVIVCETKAAFGQWTVVTAHHGELKGKRLVMHREQASREHYQQGVPLERGVQLELPLEDPN